jgi:Zn-dependent protease
MALLNDLTLQAILSRLVAYVVLAAVHGFALAAAARLMGDPAPMYNGRLTLNPMIHLSVPGLAMTILFKLGWIAPVRIDPDKLRLGRWGMIVCVLAAFAATLALVPLLWPLRQLAVLTLPRTMGYTVVIVLNTIQEVAVSFAVFNLIPLPPLTGSLLLVAIRPALARRFMLSRSLFEGLMVLVVAIGVATAVVGAMLAAMRLVLPGL